jgi:cell division transport system permease protein
MISSLTQRAVFGASSGGGRSIVPRRSIAGRSLLGVIAIMSFLACICAGGVSMVARSAANWQNDLLKEVTIQILPISGQSIENNIAIALEITQGMPGIADAEVVSDAATLSLLEPWIGNQITMDELPIPRLIVASIADGGLDVADLAERLADQVPAATVDDHSIWTQRLSVLSGTTIAVGLILLALTFTATGLSVAFATRGAMAGNREIVEVMNIVGATNSFVASEFQRHFLILGLKGGLVGGAAALVGFAIIALYASGQFQVPGADQFAMLIDVFSPGLWGYLSILFVIAFIAFITALTSRRAALQVLTATGGRAG